MELVGKCFLGNDREVFIYWFFVDDMVVWSRVSG